METDSTPAELARAHPAARTVYEFIAEMNRWEREMHESLLDEQTDPALAALPEEQIYAELKKRNEALRDRLGSILERYCEAGRNARRMSDVLHCGAPVPVYDPELELFRSIKQKGDEIIVETEMLHQFQAKLRYELVQVNDEWRIRDNRRGRGPCDKRWHAFDL